MKEIPRCFRHLSRSTSLLILGLAAIAFTGVNYAPEAASLVAADFEDPSSRVGGDGRVVAVPGGGGNRGLQFFGDEDMAFFASLPSIGRGEKYAISFRLLVPDETRFVFFDGEPAEGIRLRLRFTNRDEGSAIMDRVVSTKGEWVTIAAEFEDDGSGPYQLGVEAIWFDSLIYFDDIVVGKKGKAGMTPGLSGGGREELIGKWFQTLPWMVNLQTKLPDGVTTSVSVEKSPEEGWYDIEVREHHSPESGFDPNVSPMMGMFRVSADRMRVEFLDVVEGEYGPITPFLETWGL